jgi:hypothetical protein
MERITLSDYRNARARAQRIEGNLIIPCWVEDLSEGALSLLTEPTVAEIQAGNRLFVTVEGEPTVMLMAEVESVKPYRKWLRIKSSFKPETIRSTKSVAQRLLTIDLKGTLRHLDTLLEIEVADLSTTGAAILCSQAFNQDALVEIEMVRLGQRRSVRGRVRYAQKVGPQTYRCGIEFLRATQLEKATLNWIVDAA